MKLGVNVYGYPGGTGGTGGGSSVLDLMCIYVYMCVYTKFWNNKNEL